LPPLSFSSFPGTIAGKYPKSWIKVTLLVIAILIVMLIIFVFAEGG